MSKAHCFDILKKLFPYLTSEEIDYVRGLSDKLKGTQHKEQATLFAEQTFDKLAKLQKDRMRNRLLSVQAKNNIIDTINTIKKKGEGFSYDEKEAMISFLVGDHKHVNKNSIARGQTAASEQALSNLYKDLEAGFADEVKILHGNALNDLRGIKDQGAIKLDNDIRIELGELNKTEGGQTGKTGNKTALEMAKVFKKHLDTSIDTYQQSGGIIDSLEGWAGKQKHNRTMMKEAGFDKWFEDIYHRLDLERTYKGKIQEGSIEYNAKGQIEKLIISDDTGLDRTMTIDSIKDDMFSIYNDILDGKIFHKWGKSAHQHNKTFGVGIAGRMGKSRFLQFKDVSHEIWYNNNYNNGENILHQIKGLVQKFARDEVVLRKLGPEPYEVLKEVMNHYKDISRKTGKQIDIGFDIRDDQIIDNMTFKTGLKGLRSSAVALKEVLESGIAFGDNQMQLAKMMSNIRKFKSTTALGQIAVTSIPDSVSIGVKSVLRGEASIGKALGDVMESTLYNFKAILYPLKKITGMGNGDVEEAYALARSFGFGVQSILGDISTHLHEVTDKNMIDKINRVFWKLNLEEMRNNLQEALIARTFSSRLAHDAGKDFSQLSKFRQTFLKSYEIDAKKWELMRKHMHVDLDSGGKEQFGKMILPDLASRIPDAEIKQFAKPDILAGGKITQRSIDVARKELQQQITSMYRGEVDAALMKQSGRTRAAMLMGTKAGTPLGEFMRFNTQFLSYITEFTGQILSQVWSHPNITTTGKLGALVGMGATYSIFSYLGMATKDILAGKEPRKINQETMIEAFRQSGITGVYGEYAGRIFQPTGKNNPFMTDSVMDRNVVNTIFGASLSNIYDIGKTVKGDVEKSIKSGRIKADADRYKLIAKGQIPGQNLFYMQPIINALMTNVVLSPKEVRRQKRYMKKTYDQKYYIPTK